MNVKKLVRKLCVATVENGQPLLARFAANFSNLRSGEISHSEALASAVAILGIQSMTNASDLVNHVVSREARVDVPPRVYEIVERHRQTLLNLANTLISAGRKEDEVVGIILKASESFSMELKAKTKGLRP